MAVGTTPVRVTAECLELIEAIGKKVKDEGVSNLPPRFRRHLQSRVQPTSNASILQAAVAEMIEAVDPVAAARVRKAHEDKGE